MIKLVQLSESDGVDVYKMLQRIKTNENEFKNTANGLSFEEYKKWLIQQNNWSKGKDLPEGFVPQTVYWLCVDGRPVGFGKIRHKLNIHSRTIGGNLGYAIDPIFRGKGYATVLLNLLVAKAKELGIGELLLSVEKSNPASKRVIEKNGGTLYDENEARWFFTF